MYEEYTGEECTYIYIQYMIRFICLKNGKGRLLIQQMKDLLN